MKKPIYILLGILLLFVIIYFLLVQKEKRTFSPRKTENFLGLDSAQVDRIEFKKFDTKLVFKKLNQRWHITQPESYRADNQAVGRMLSMASHMEVGEIISSNPEKQLLFQVDSLTGTGLDFFSGENLLASVVLGKMSDDYMHAYLRKTNSDDVYLAKSNFAGIANRRIEQWRNRSIFSFEPHQVKEIEFIQGAERFKLTKEDTLWEISPDPYQKSSPTEGQTVEDYIGTLASMKADEFAKAPEIAEVDFEKPQLELKLSFLDGHEERLFAFRMNEESRYLVRSDQDESIFVLFEYNFKRLAKTTEDFPPQEGT
jgi:hypothetical protein